MTPKEIKLIESMSDKEERLLRRSLKEIFVRDKKADKLIDKFEKLARKSERERILDLFKDDSDDDMISVYQIRKLIKKLKTEK